MAYDEKLADRIRDQLSPTESVAEIKMFGGLCFTVNGNMACGVMKSGLLVRVPEEQFDTLLSQPGARTFDIMPGRTPKGFIVVDAKAISTKPTLQKWVARGVAVAASMPPKAKGKAKKKPLAKKK
ncbi:MAG TPA: TfoX/Sxy family protein [Actinomycetota bacterium]|nr:TfoX/Sxy family protein [Actinomycetota bacterium]